MIATLAAALSLAAALAIDVPYLPQTDALVRRRGGGDGVPLLGRRARRRAVVRAAGRSRAGGIADDALTGGRPSARLARRQRRRIADAIRAAWTTAPVIVLLPDRGDRYHYVVVIGASGAGILVHDPSWGPSRSIRAPDFERAVAGGRLLVAGDPTSRSGLTFLTANRRTAGLTLSADQVPRNPAAAECDARLNRALDEIRARGLDQADALLDGVRRNVRPAPGPFARAERRPLRAAPMDRRRVARARGARTASRVTSTRSTCSVPACSCSTTRSARCARGIKSASRASTACASKGCITCAIRRWRR